MISEQDQRHYLGIARRAAEAAEVIRTHAPGRLTEKGDRDPASEVDWLSSASFATSYITRRRRLAFWEEEAVIRAATSCLDARSHRRHG